jgi:hypothetical protein
MDVRQGLVDGRVDLPRWGAVRAGDRPSLPYVVVDADAAVVEPVSRFLRHLALGDRSRLTVRSYANDLLRWWRVLGLLQVGWDRAGVDEVAVMVGWLRAASNPQRRRGGVAAGGVVNLKTGKTQLGSGYAASTINHALSVVSRFYEFHAGRGGGRRWLTAARSRRRRGWWGGRRFARGCRSGRRVGSRTGCGMSCWRR